MELGRSAALQAAVSQVIAGIPNEGRCVSSDRVDTVKDFLGQLQVI
jgi:hypothetical protein